LRKARPRASARESSSRFAQWRLGSRRLQVFSGLRPFARLCLSLFQSCGVAGTGLQSPLRIGLDRGNDLSGDDLSRARGFKSVVLSEANKDGRPSDRTTDLKPDRKSTRLNSSHVAISYAVFCLKKKKKIE